MDKPRIFLGSSATQAKLLQSLTRGLVSVAQVEPWSSFIQSWDHDTGAAPATSCTRSISPPSYSLKTTGQPTAEPHPNPAELAKLTPRDNVVFEAGLFGGVLGMRRTFILHASGAKLPSDLLGLTLIRYGEAMTAAEMRDVNQKLRRAIESEGRIAGIEGMWWQFSLTERSSEEPSAVSLLRISRDRDGMLELTGRSWQADGTLSARYWSEATREKRDPPGIFYYHNLERPRHPNAPRLDGTGEIRIESADRAAGYWTTRSDTDTNVSARTSGVYLRADPDDLSILDGRDDRKRAELIAERLGRWESVRNA